MAGADRRNSRFALIFPGGGIDNASARTRLYAYLPYLGARGLRWHIASYTWHKYDSRRGRPPLTLREKLWLELLPLRTFLHFIRADTLFFQKQEINKFAAWLGKRLGKRIVYDIDDAIYLSLPERKAGLEPHRIALNEQAHGRITWILRRCDLALVSGDELARFCLQFAKKVRILPSVLPAVAVKPAPAGRKPVIGWVGAPENQRYLREIEQVLLRLQGEIPELEVWIVTSQLMDPPPRFRYRFIPWSLTAEAEAIPAFTVGVAPLVDDAWCRAKMNYKALVYLSHGVPAVVTPVGFPVDDFEDGRNILLARTEEDWYRQLASLVSDPARRDELAAGGLAVVHQKFSAEGRAAEFAAALTG